MMNKFKNKEEEIYWKLHEVRLNKTVDAAKKILGKNSSSPRILDIGPHFLTLLLKERIPAASIDTLGFWLDGIGLESVVEKHYPFDLADIAQGEFPEMEHTYDLITMAEVLEHLYVSPRLVLSSLLKILKPDGTLLLTTPNGVALSKRVKMLLGINPFEIPREDLKNPGHFREYTAREMIALGKEAGFSSVSVSQKNVYPCSKPTAMLCRIFPSLSQNLYCLFHNSIT